MFPGNRSHMSVPPKNICLFLVDQSNYYYIQVWKNSISSSRTLQNPELVRVAYKSMKFFSVNTTHGSGLKF